MRNLLRNKWLLAVLAAAVIGGGAYAFAATLGITSGNLQAGNQTVNSCQAANISSTYQTAWDTALTPDAYGVSSVKLSSIDPACVGSTLSVSLTDSSGAQLGGGDLQSAALTANDVTGGTPGFITISATTLHIPAEDVGGISVAVAGP
jgi:hypothetical protein